MNELLFSSSDLTLFKLDLSLTYDEIGGHTPIPHSDHADAEELVRRELVIDGDVLLPRSAKNQSIHSNSLLNSNWLN